MAGKLDKESSENLKRYVEDVLKRDPNMSAEDIAQGAMASRICGSREIRRSTIFYTIKKLEGKKEGKKRAYKTRGVVKEVVKDNGSVSLSALIQESESFVARLRTCREAIILGRKNIESFL